MKTKRKHKHKRVYIHYGDDQFVPEKFGKVRNNGVWTKPDHRSCLWASPVESKFGWKDWCEMEGYDPTNGFDTSFRFVLKDDAHVAHIRTEEDMSKITPFIIPNSYLDFYHEYDFEKIAERYDAIELHLTEDPTGVRGQLYYLLYGWDCDSILILNPDVVQEVR